MVLLLIIAATVCLAQDSPFSDAKSLIWRAQALESEGKITQAWLLYNQAAMLDSRDPLAAGKAAQLRSKALEGAVFPTNSPATPAVEIDPNDPLIKITDQEMRDIERLLPPPNLKPKDTRLTLTLTADSKTIYTRILEHFGLEVLFDGEYDNPTNRQVKLENATFAEATYIAGITTGSFINPISEKLAMVVRDTDQKRREQERNVAIALPMPTAISSPEAQELGRAIQQIFELQRVSIDTVRGMMLIRDRWSKVKFAELSLNQMLHLRGQVMIDVEFYEVNQQSNYSFGFALPTSTQLVPMLKDAVLGRFGTFGLGVTGASLFASMTYSNTQSLYQSQIRSLDGLPATVHIGDRYPIITQTTSFGNNSLSGGLATAPQVQFEDLGLTVKITPHMHGNGEISLEVDSEFKVLTGQTNNDIPVISNRKYTGTVRLKPGEWAVASGLVTQNESINRSGLAGIARIPVIGAALSTNGRDRQIGQTLLVIRPRIIGAVAADQPAREMFTGSETRFLAPTH
jgi:general secretion pathway protein D